MKRCPKCSRAYPDENQKFCTVDGGLLVADQNFDPNATIQATTNISGSLPQPPAQDPNRTVISKSAATEVFKSPPPTGPTGAETIIDHRLAPASRVAPPPAPVAAPAPATAPPRKKSKLPLILGLLVLLLVLGVGGVIAAFFLVIKPALDERERDRASTVVTENRNENVNTSANTNEAPPPEPPTMEFVPPPGTIKFTNSNADLDGKLAEHYLDFSFYYPKNWQSDPNAGVPGASNFAKVERRLPPDFTQENFAVGWYTSNGTFAADESKFPQLVQILSGNLSGSFPEYKKVSEGPTKINSMDAYEFRFTSVSKGTEKGDINLWGRVVFLPPGVEGATNGATIIMLATSLAPELAGPDDVGVKGEMPVILESFRFGKN